MHVDAAYGGYFTLAVEPRRGRATRVRRGAEADSIVIDPHKHGLQPYGCGCVLFRDPAVGAVYRHDSPYTYFTSDELHLGEISLECSRPGAAAVALWATSRLLPSSPADGSRAGSRRAGGARSRCTRAWPRTTASRRSSTPSSTSWCGRCGPAPPRKRPRRARGIFEAAARRDLHLALAAVPARLVGRAVPGLAGSDETVTCLRACVMKPEHEAWLDGVLQRLGGATREVVGGA